VRWFVFFIFAYVMLGAQIGVGDQLRVGGAGVNFVVLAVVFICLNTSREAALSAALILGLLQDLATSTTAPGLHGFAYSVVGLFIVRANRQVYPDHPLTHFFVCGLAQCLVAATIFGHSYLRPPEGMTHVAAWPLAGSAIYTAAIAPIVLGLLSRGKALFGFNPVKRRVRSY